MKPWEIVESINTIGYVKTFEKITQQRDEDRKRRSAGDLTWEEIVERNKRNPSKEREPGDE